MANDIFFNGRFYRRMYFPEYESEPQRRCRICDLYKQCKDTNVNCSATNVFRDVDYFQLNKKDNKC